jgi:hypothetical protein
MTQSGFDSQDAEAMHDFVRRATIGIRQAAMDGMLSDDEARSLTARVRAAAEVHDALRIDRARRKGGRST